MSTKFLLNSFLATLFLYIFIFLKFTKKELVPLDIFLTCFSFVFLYYFILLITSKNNILSNETLIVGSTLFIGFLYMFLFNTLFYNYTGAYFEFTGSDSTIYQHYSLRALRYDYFDGLIHFIKTTRYSFDDVGMIAYLSFFYRIIESTLFTRTINVLINSFTALLIYKTSLRFLTNKTALIVSIIYGIASYTVYYVSSGLKEIVFTFFVVASFFFYSKYCEIKKTKFLFYSLGFSLILLLFRIPIALFVLMSISFTEFFYKNWSVKKLIFLILITGISLYLVLINLEVIVLYLRATNQAEDSGIYNTGLLFNVLVVLSGFFGPFPTILPLFDYRDSSLWAPSLILKVFVSIYFIYGVYLVFKNKVSFLVCTATMCLLTIVSLIIAQATFKVRYIIPYLPLFFIIVGYANDVFSNTKEYPFLKKTILPVNFVLIVFIYYWNILRT